ncbi:MAG: GGDEF domain-containing protein [Spirochaetia bacterium]|nr:GGDEF domain-containing protein [Spirochaetia bacterium]
MDTSFNSFLKRYRIEYVITAAAAMLVMEILFGFWKKELTALMSIDSVKFWYNVVLTVISCFMVFIAAISYPKIYKFRLLLSAGAVAAVMFCYMTVATPFFPEFRLANFKFNFLQRCEMFTGNFPLQFLFTVMNAALLAVMLSGPTVNYGKGKAVSLWTAVGITVIYLSLFLVFSEAYRAGADPYSAFVKNVRRFAEVFTRYSLPLNLVIMVLTIIFSILNIEEEHNYGSIIVAASLLTYYCHLCLVFDGSYYKLKLMMPVIALIMLVGIFAHWVSCLSHKAHYDPLLKIYNRQFMDSIISGVADVDLGREFSVMMCDIDHFKDVNDTHGHAAGDEVLHRVAQIIRDTALPDGVVCRYGGEEIIVFLRGKTDEEAVSKAERIRKAVKKQGISYKSKSIKITMSIGVASSKHGLDGIDKAIKRADDNVYKAKKKGRDRVVSE